MAESIELFLNHSESLIDQPQIGPSQPIVVFRFIGHVLEYRNHDG